MSEPDAAALLACPSCGHDIGLHDEVYGCLHTYSDTTRGRGGVGGQALTGCGCRRENAQAGRSGEAGDERV